MTKEYIDDKMEIRKYSRIGGNVMLAVKGIIQGNTVVFEDEDIRNYDGRDVIVTILDYPYKKTEPEKLDLDKFVTPTERGKNADEYIKELRANDRV